MIGGWGSREKRRLPTEPETTYNRFGGLSHFQSTSSEPPSGCTVYLRSLAMIGRLTGTLESLDELSALVSVPGGVAYEVSVPAFLAERLASRV